MKHSYLRTGSAIGLLFAFGCSGGTAGSVGGRGEIHADEMGGANATGGNANATAGKGGSDVKNATTAAGASSSTAGSNSGIAGSGSADSTVAGNAGAGFTQDPPPPSNVGGSGNTQDPPPPPSNVGGSGNTQDPPPPPSNVGGSGNTQDPPPPPSNVGGSGNTQDPPPPPSNVGGSSGTGGSSAVGGAVSTGGTPSTGGSSSAGGTPSTGGSPSAGGTTATATGGTSSLGGSTSTGGTGNVSHCALSEIDKVNVVVFKDAAPSSADSEGRMWVGGNATFQGGGYSANSTNVPALKLTCDDYGVVVGGNLNGTLILGSGKAAYGGTRNGNFYSNANPQCGIYKETPVDFVAVESSLKSYSAQFRDTPANGTVTSTYGSLILTGIDPTLNVFNVSAAQIAATTEFRLEVPTSSATVVNISGTDIHWQNAGFVMPDGGKSCKNGNSTSCHSVLYNLYEAQTVSLGGIGVQGSILAPYATIDGGNGSVDGQVISEYLYGALEYHPFFFTACLPMPTR